MVDRKKKSAIVFSLTKNMIFALASVVIDIEKKIKHKPDEIVVFHDGIKKKDQRLINKIFPTVFVKYKFPIKRIRGFNQGTITYFSKMVFAKFECLRLLTKYKTVLFLDYDQVIKSDISNLMLQCQSGAKMLESDGKVEDQLHEQIVGVDMEANAYCASVMAFFDNIGDYNRMYEWCYKKTAEYAQYLYAPEQAIFALMFKEFDVVPETVPLKEYCCHPRDADDFENVKVIHAYGQPKFWDGISNMQWNENYCLWVKMGGTKKHKSSMNYLVVKKIKLFAKALTLRAHKIIKDCKKV